MLGLAEGLKGWRKANKPAAWDALAAKLSDVMDPTIQARMQDLSVLFGDGRSLDELRTVALNSKVSVTSRETALRTLIAARAPDLRSVCERLLAVRFLNAIAVQGLALFDDFEVGKNIAKSYSRFDPNARESVVQTLLTRSVFVRALLSEIAAGGIPRSVLTPFYIRQIRGLGDPSLNAELTSIWGEAREPAADKRVLIETLKKQLNTEVLAQANKSNGRILFSNLCSACHTLHGHGGRIGPDLTGCGRSDLDYLLPTIVDPGANVSADFRMNVVTLKDGRTLSGMAAGNTPRTLTLQGVTEKVTFERSEIASQQELTQSMMPEGLLESLTGDQMRDLIGYLMHPTQVPMTNNSPASGSNN